MDMECVRPTLLLDETLCRKNIQRIAAKALKSNVRLRPHFKTHQSHEIGRWFREEGVDRCTVSSMKMATYFAADGWQDITVAFPLNFLEAEEINRLAAVTRLHLCIDNSISLQRLLARLKHAVHCFIEVDTGFGRTGINPIDHAAIDAILSIISSSPLLTFSGFMSHAGHSYACRSVAEIQKIHEVTVGLMRKLGEYYRRDFPGLQLSVGDTPTCSVATDFNGIDEIRPGNLVFYDLSQCVIGSSAIEQIAIAMACPVVALYPERQEVIVHGGGVHFSKDFLRRQDGTIVYGEVVRLHEKGWDLPPLPMYVKSLSQEHGILYAPKEEVSKIKIGDLLGILPVHACLTADAMGEYVTLEGKRIAMMPKIL